MLWNTRLNERSEFLSRNDIKLVIWKTSLKYFSKRREKKEKIFWESSFRGHLCKLSEKFYILVNARWKIYYKGEGPWLNFFFWSWILSKMWECVSLCQWVRFTWEQLNKQTQIRESCSQRFYWVGLGQGLRICILKKNDLSSFLT